MVNSAPLPGENWTSDRSNYPWHMPPEYTDVDVALDKLSDVITDFETATGFLVLAEMGVPLYRIASTVLMAGVSSGKWNIDLALLMAGPLTKMIEMICIGFDVPYDTGLSDKPVKFNTGAFFTGGTPQVNDAGLQGLKDAMPDIKDQASTQDTPEGVDSTEEPATASAVPDLTAKGSQIMKGFAAPIERI